MPEGHRTPVATQQVLDRSTTLVSEKVRVKVENQSFSLHSFLFFFRTVYWKPGEGGI